MGISLDVRRAEGTVTAAGAAAMSTLQMKSSGVHIQPILDVEIGIGGGWLGLAIRHGHPRPIPWSCRHATRCFSGRFSRASTTDTKPTFSVHGGGKGPITRGLRGKVAAGMPLVLNSADAVPVESRMVDAVSGREPFGPRRAVATRAGLRISIFADGHVILAVVRISPARGVLLDAFPSAVVHRDRSPP